MKSEGGEYGSVSSTSRHILSFFRPFPFPLSLGENGGTGRWLPAGGPVSMLAWRRAWPPSCCETVQREAMRCDGEGKGRGEKKKKRMCMFYDFIWKGGEQMGEQRTFCFIFLFYFCNCNGIRLVSIFLNFRVTSIISLNYALWWVAWMLIKCLPGGLELSFLSFRSSFHVLVIDCHICT